MNAKDLLNKLKPPCAACPYKLGLVKTFVNPCPQCKLSGYRMFEEFKIPKAQGTNSREKKGKESKFS